jgi:dTDP-4-amino-4,6-dideoxygalactose transaminase
MAALSFHETKNIISGEGGALLINDPRFVERAEVIWEKGTNRGQYFRGEVDKYTWVDLGSSYLPGEIVAAFLWAQMEEADQITGRRLAIWNRYHDELASLEEDRLFRRPIVPNECVHNAHMYYVLLPDLAKRGRFIERLNAQEIRPVFHYVPLHSSPFGQHAGRSVGSMAITDGASERLVRLPLWLGLEEHLDRVISEVSSAARSG